MTRPRRALNHSPSPPGTAKAISPWSPGPRGPPSEPGPEDQVVPEITRCCTPPTGTLMWIMAQPSVPKRGGVYREVARLATNNAREQKPGLKATIRDPLSCNPSGSCETSGESTWLR